MSLLTYFGDHVWAPVIASVALLVLVVALGYWIYLASQRRRVNPDVVVERGLSEHLTAVQTQRLSEERAAALVTCKYFLRGSPEYSFLEQFPELGSRMQKHWFAVRSSTKGDMMMMILPRSPTCAFPWSKKVRGSVQDIFAMVKHPFVFPVVDFDMMDTSEPNQAIFLQPLCPQGSLKDVIYNSTPVHPWGVKYRHKGSPLSVRRIGIYGRQILEGMLFLQGLGLTYGQLHAGNVMMVEDTCRITGYENSLFGYRSRMHPLVKPVAKKDKKAADSLCFGHLIYEMALGYELETAKPSLNQLLGQCPPELQEVLSFIFFSVDEIPSLEQIRRHVFFGNVPLPSQLANFQQTRMEMTPQMKEILAAVEADRAVRTKSKSRTSIASAPGEASALSPQAINYGSQSPSS
eukprot:m.145368 g.145368  ORF g.145368 m.145368 type:complete len:405 (+) comp16784_c0_seq9:254-1468(+)